MNQFDAVLIVAARERECREKKSRQLLAARVAEWEQLIGPVIQKEQAKELQARAGFVAAL